MPPRRNWRKQGSFWLSSRNYCQRRRLSTTFGIPRQACLTSTRRKSRRIWLPLSASIDQIYDVLPEGKAKEHAKKAKDILAKDKQKGAAKAKETLDLVEEAIAFREVDLSVSYTSRLVKVAQADLDKGKTKEASDALTSVADGVLVFDTAVIDPVDVAVRRIWLATQEYAGKDHKAAKTRLEKAKMALEEVVQRSDKAVQERAKNLIAKIEAIDVNAVDKAGAALESLWQDARKLVERQGIKGKS